MADRPDEREWQMSSGEERLEARASRMRQTDGLPRAFRDIAEEIGRGTQRNSAPALYDQGDLKWLLRRKHPARRVRRPR
jgi:hypothetical protein